MSPLTRWLRRLMRLLSSSNWATFAHSILKVKSGTSATILVKLCSIYCRDETEKFGLSYRSAEQW